MTIDLAELYILENMLEQKGLDHLYVRKHGEHLVIYSIEADEKVNRARLTKVTKQYYQIGMADHRGKWETTPFRGTMSEMFTLLINDFSFVLAPWS